MVLVRKANNIWRMCVDFADLNATCLKDPYPLSDNDRLINVSLGCHMLSFMDAYLGYDQIGWAPWMLPK